MVDKCRRWKNRSILALDTSQAFVFLNFPRRIIYDCLIIGNEPVFLQSLGYKGSAFKVFENVAFGMPLFVIGNGSRSILSFLNCDTKLFIDIGLNLIRIA